MHVIKYFRSNAISDVGFFVHNHAMANNGGFLYL